MQLFSYSETANIDPRITKGLSYLKSEMAKGELAAGRHEKNTDGLYLVVLDYDTPNAGEYFEAHRTYIDVQIMLKGSEVVEVFLLGESNAKTQTEYVPEHDYVLYHRPDNKITMQNIVLAQGNVAVFYPNDAHRTGLMHQSVQSIRKVIIKVPV